MSNKLTSLLLFVIFIVLGIAELRQCSNDKDPFNDPQVQAEFRRRDLAWKAKLIQSDSARAADRLRSDSLALIVDSLARRSEKLDTVLKEVDHKFINLTSKELQAKMLEEYAKRER